jgi:hypothetical protein
MIYLPSYVSSTLWPQGRCKVAEEWGEVAMAMHGCAGTWYRVEARGSDGWLGEKKINMVEKEHIINILIDVVFMLSRDNFEVMGHENN